MLLDLAKVNIKGILTVPPDIRKYVLPKSPQSKHQLHQAATFSCNYEDVQKINAGKLKFIIYYDGNTKAAYLLDSSLFIDKISYVDYIAKTSYGPRSKRTFVGYVKPLIEAGNFLECKRFE